MKRRAALAGMAGLLGAVPLARLGATASGSRARWITLGTSGGPQVQAGRAQIANALVVDKSLYLFDLGNDVQRQLARAGLPEANLRAAFLSHHHLDHNADLGPVMMTHWLFGQGRLPIYGPVGTKALVAGIARANAPTALASFPTIGPAKPSIEDTVTAADIPALAVPTEIYRDQHVAVSAIAVDHFQAPPSVLLPELPQALAVRVEASGLSVVYSGDTGPSQGLEVLARDADYLFVEVVDLAGIAARLAQTMPGAPAAIRDNVVNGMRVNHLTPDEIGRIAAAARVKCVVLTHFVPIPEQLARPHALAEGVRRHFRGRIVLARDLDSFS